MVKSTIYKITCKTADVTDCYVGRTIDVTTRFSTHRSNCYNENRPTFNYKLYKTIREHGGFENWNFEEIENIEHDIEDTTPAREREFYWFNLLNATLNHNIPNQSQKESTKKWRDNNKEHARKYGKTYKENNKEKIKEKSKEYYEENKERLKENCKKWIEENREKNRTYQRERCRRIAEEKRLKKLEAIETPPF